AEAGTFSIVVSNGFKRTGAASFVVNSAPTQTEVTSSPNPSAPGQAVTFVAAVAVGAPNTGTPTGTGGFFGGPNVPGTNALSGGQASFTTASLSQGTHWINAVYEGDGNCSPSTNSDGWAQVVGDAGPAIASATALYSAVNPTVFGQLATFTATVSSSV